MDSCPSPAGARLFAAAAGFPSPVDDDPGTAARRDIAGALNEELGRPVTVVPGGFLVAGLTVSSPAAVKAVAAWAR